jgi:hypothetical protein
MILATIRRVPNAFRTLQGRLVLGMSLLVLLIVVESWIGHTTVQRISADVGSGFTTISQTARLSFEHADALSSQVMVADGYLSSAHPEMAVQFRDHGRRAREARTRLRGLPAVGERQHRGIELHRQPLAHLCRQLGMLFGLCQHLTDAAGQVSRQRKLAAVIRRYGRL